MEATEKFSLLGDHAKQDAIKQMPSAKSTILDYLGEEFDIYDVSGGLVHQVWMVSNQVRSLFVKKRLTRFTGVTSIECNPEDIVHEYNALKMFTKVCPGIVPEVIHFNKEDAIILMSDVSNGGSTMQELFDNDVVDMKILFKIGTTLKGMHESTRSVRSIRSGSDEDYYNSNMLYRFKYHQNEGLNYAVERLSAMPRNIITGDMAPKNIIVTPKNDIRIVDLESAHLGNPEMDVGYCLGHILLHNLESNDLEGVTTAFINGYFGVNKVINEDLLVRICIGSMLYRLKNEVIPYKLPYSKNFIDKITKGLYSLLASKELSISDLLNMISRQNSDILEARPEVELEVKILEIDPVKIEKRLRVLGAKELLNDETDVETFDLPENHGLDAAVILSSLPDKFKGIAIAIRRIISTNANLDAIGAYLRLRRQGGDFEFTLKYPEGEQKSLKQEVELNVDITKDEWPMLKESLLQNGFEIRHRLRKKRVSFQHPKLAARYDIDTWIDTPIPPYIEVEASSRKTIDAAISDIGLDPTTATSMSGKDLFALYNA